MADNISIKNASGTTITVGSDDVGGVQYPRHKVVWGANGAVNDTAASTPLPVEATQSGDWNTTTIPSDRSGYVKHREFRVTFLNTPPQVANFTDLPTGGSLLPNTTYRASVAPKYIGEDGFKTIGSGISVGITPTANDGNSTHAARVTVPQIPYATSYLLFFSTATSPTYIGEITEAQRASGGYQITALDTVSSGGSSPAGTVDILVESTIGQYRVPGVYFASPESLFPVFPHTLADITTGGVLNANNSYNVQVSPVSRFGFGRATPSVAVVTANDGNATHGLRLTLPQTPNADRYAIFVDNGTNASTDSKFLAFVTETQRATAGCRITAFGQVDNAGSNLAGTVDILTHNSGGVPVSGAPFAATSAHPPYVPELLTPIDCTGYQWARIFIEMSDWKDVRTTSSATYAVEVLEKVANDPTHWGAIFTGGVSLPSSTVSNAPALPASGNNYSVNVAGSSEVVVCIQSSALIGTYTLRVYVDLFN